MYRTILCIVLQKDLLVLYYIRYYKKIYLYCNDNYNSYKMYFTDEDRDIDDDFKSDNINNDTDSFCIWNRLLHNGDNNISSSSDSVDLCCYRRCYYT